MKELQVGEIVIIDDEKYYCEFGEGRRGCASCGFGHKHNVWYEGCPIEEFGYDCGGDVCLMSSSLKIRLIDSEIKRLQELKEKLQ